MIKDFFVVDNAFKEPLILREYLLAQNFYTHENYNLPGINIVKDNLIPDGAWRGFRTQNLYFTDPEKSKKLTFEIFSKAFTNINFSYDFTAYGHICSGQLSNTLQEKEMWHKDPQTFAGVVYLNEEPASKCGTLLKIDGKNIEIDNMFNRMVIYRGNIIHKVENSFGNHAKNSRLTFTFFIRNIMFF
jgi:hypothetical protein